MKITNKTAGWAIILLMVLTPFIEWYIHGCEYYSVEHSFSFFRAAIPVLLAFLGVIGLVVLLVDLFYDDIKFEYEIKLPRSKRSTLNKLYRQMGEAAMQGDKAEEDRLWEVIQKIEKAGL